MLARALGLLPLALLPGCFADEEEAAHGPAARAVEEGPLRADPATPASSGSPEEAGFEGGRSWPVHRGQPSLAGVAPGSLPAAPVLLWRFEAGGAITSSPVVHEGRVFFGSDDGSLYAVALEDGARLWAFPTQDVIEAPPLVHAGKVFVGSSDFFLYAVDAASGELVWKAEVDDKILGGANRVPGPDGRERVVVGCYDSRLYCFDAATGERVWAYETENYVNGTPAVAGGKVVVGGCDAVLHVVSAETGEPLERIELGEGCHVAGSVALDETRAYFGHYGNAFVCVDYERGEEVWSYTHPTQPFFSSPALGVDRVVFGGRDKHLHCASRDDGRPLWTFPTRRKVDGSPVICGDAVVFGSGDGRLYIVGLADGEERWSYELGRSVLSSPAVVDGRFIVGCNDGFLYAFGRAPGPDDGDG